MLPTLVVGRRVHRPNPDPIRRPVTGGADPPRVGARFPTRSPPGHGRGRHTLAGSARLRSRAGRPARTCCGRRASGPAGSPRPGDGARCDRVGVDGAARRVRDGAARRVRDGAGSCGNGDGGLAIRTGSGMSLRETMCYACYEVMAVSTITHRELRNNSASILRRVQAGETFEVTNNGEPVALLSPAGGERLALLRRRGAVTPRARIDFARLRRATGIASRDVLDDLRGER